MPSSLLSFSWLLTQGVTQLYFTCSLRWLCAEKYRALFCSDSTWTLQDTAQDSQDLVSAFCSEHSTTIGVFCSLTNSEVAWTTEELVLFRTKSIPQKTPKGLNFVPHILTDFFPTFPPLTHEKGSTVHMHTSYLAHVHGWFAKILSKQ